MSMTADVICPAEPRGCFCRDHGPRGDRQKTRLIWCIEELGGVEPFRAKVSYAECRIEEGAGQESLLHHNTVNSCMQLR